MLKQRDRLVVGGRWKRKRKRDGKGRELKKKWSLSYGCVNPPTTHSTLRVKEGRSSLSTLTMLLFFKSHAYRSVEVVVPVHNTIRGRPTVTETGSKTSLDPMTALLLLRQPI